MNQPSEPVDGAKQVYELLVREHGQSLFRIAARMVGNSVDADDLVQETFTEAWRSIDKLRSPEAGFAWLLQIMRFRWARLMKERGKLQSNIGGEGIDCASRIERTDETPTRLAEMEVLEMALGQLDERFKLPFLLVVMEGMSVADVASHLELRKGTVLSRVHRAKKRLAETIREIEARANTPSAAATARTS